MTLRQISETERDREEFRNENNSSFFIRPMIKIRLFCKFIPIKLFAKKQTNKKGQE